MKIGIITHYDVHNHGAILQLYAMVRILRSRGHEVKALTYKKNYDFLEDYADTKYNISLKSVPYYIHYLIEKGIFQTGFNYKKRKILNSFKSEKNLIGGYYSKEIGLDAVFIGSDEIFSIEPGLNPCFWGMGVPCEKVYSYAGSFGPTTIGHIKEHCAVEFIAAGIERINRISVRDMNSKMIIEAISDKKVEVVCDPVILYGYREEAEKYEPPSEEPYLLVYAYDSNMNDDIEIKYIKKYAKEKKLKIISTGFYHRWCDKCINVTPIELLRYIKYAKCVVTDTFHGSVMSIVMNTEFFCKIRGNSNKLEFLLNEYNLNHRILDSFQELNDIGNKKIDFNMVNREVEVKREQAISFLDSCLSESIDE